MNTTLNLREIERKAFRSIYQDGLWDLYFGLIVICMSVFIYRPASGYSPLNIILALCSMGVVYALFWAEKRLITLPRMGQVQFGAKREKRKRTMIIVLTIVVIIQVGLFLIQLLAWAYPVEGARFNNLIPNRNIMDLVVASIGALIVGPSMVLVAYFRDFPRGYFIAIMIALAVFLMLYLNQPIYPIIIGLLISLPGVVLLIRFLLKYPLNREGVQHE